MLRTIEARVEELNTLLPFDYRVFEEPDPRLGDITRQEYNLSIVILQYLIGTLESTNTYLVLHNGTRELEAIRTPHTSDHPQVSRGYVAAHDTLPLTSHRESRHPDLYTSDEFYGNSTLLVSLYALRCARTDGGSVELAERLTDPDSSLHT